ncbi:pantoate--beta-alanine ligase [Aeromicrobium endophyticum]|uniref:Pantothenate synthetase n=1 Tax=Aeromicrobium endophyticum TaxID=2292704 RepID=A0A371PAL1_9ACTN|nr:pantoate--beta-alanine ligase [Aeromicrobium endophyticum]REK72558.1 pantoate--beta-alanine ligase [Aeromicrobium endophyticum]
MAGPIVARTRAELVAARGASSVSFVPTMGALHDGHVQLLKHARPLGETLVASIFVNPTQFAPGEDYDDYPRTFDTDLERCAEAGVDVVFAPTVPVMYPSGLVDTVTVDPGPLGAILEGASRPTHFRGVLTVVAKLFGLVRPDVAVFGEKDFQQLTLIRQMARELALGVDVVGCPTVREADGLAMSSRNRYLSADERATAAAISAALRAGVAAAAGGPDAVLAAAHAVIDPADVDLDYLVLTDPELGPAVPGADARLLVAARVGRPRLLDNIGLTLGRPS